MREPEFRALYVGDGICQWFVYGSLVLVGKDEASIERWTDGDHEMWAVERETAGESIGIKDKLGVEIYEGDAVKYTHPKEPHNTQPCDFIGVIEYVDCLASYRVVNDTHGWEEVIHQDIILEVIGNIHESPELIE